MRHEEQTWNASELIYLFVDGEANDVQKSTLFSALANDTDLQTEFADALQINAAAKSERGAIIPPSHVTTGLFQKAGISAGAIVTSGAARTGAVVGTGSAVGLTSLFRKVATPVFSAFLGAAIALFLVPEIAPWASDSGSSRETIAQSVAPAQPAEKTQAAPNEHSAPTVPNTPAGQKNTTSVLSSSRAGAKEGRNSSLPHQLNNAQTLTIAEKSTATTTSTAPTGNIASSAAETMQPLSAEEMVNIRLAMAPDGTPHSAGSIDDLKRQESPSQRSKTGTDVPPAPTGIVASQTFPRLSVQLRGMADVQMFPHRSLQSSVAAPAFDNIAVAAFYNVSRNHALGIEVGREYHPLYVATAPPVLEEQPDVSGTQPEGSDGPGIIFTDANNLLTPTTLAGNARYTMNEEDIQSYKLESYSKWAGLSYRYRANELSNVLPLRPYIQTVLGASNFGPIGKAMAGLSWQPDSRVTFSLGLEGTSIFYRQDGAWYSTRKLGASYAAQIEF